MRSWKEEEGQALGQLQELLPGPAQGQGPGLAPELALYLPSHLSLYMRSSRHWLLRRLTCNPAQQLDPRYLQQWAPGGVRQPCRL